MTLSMMFLRSFMDMVKVRLENLDYAKTEDIGQTLSVLVTVAVEIETTDLLRLQQISIQWPKHLQKLQKRLLDCRRTRRRHVLILHLQAKYAKKNNNNNNNKKDCKNEIYAKNWVKSTWTARSQPWQKVNCQRRRSSVNRIVMT